MARSIFFATLTAMAEKKVTEKELTALAKKFREASGKNRAEASRELKVSRIAIIHAEEKPQASMFKLRKRIIERYSTFKVIGPEYRLVDS
jgi:hypothetical protein